MTAKSKRRRADEDEAQSRRFLDLAHELESKGELSPDDSGQAFEQLFAKVVSKPKASGEPK